MYLAFLSIHNILRWLVILFALLAIIRSFAGLFGNKAWSQADDRAGLLYTVIFDIQLLIGLILYVFLSPFPRVMFNDMGAAMQDAITRFFAVEHVLVMVAALVVAHIGRSLSQKASDAAIKHRRAAIWYTISFVMLLLSIPWPFLQGASRPWLRMFGLDF